jgi:hypothetical protein
MFINRIKICPDLHKLQLWLSRLRQWLFLKLLRQWTHKMGRFLSTLKHSHPSFIWYTNSCLRLEFVYQIKIGCSCFNYRDIVLKIRMHAMYNASEVRNYLCRFSGENHFFILLRPISAIWIKLKPVFHFNRIVPKRSVFQQFSFFLGHPVV